MRQHLVNRLSRVALGSFFALLLVTGSVTTAQAEQTFGVQHLQGSYGLYADGTIEGVGPVVAIGVFTFDGKGGCTFVEILNIAGLGSSARTADGCTYTVGPNGMGTITEFFQPASESHLGFVIVDNAKELRIIVTDPGVLAGGVAKKQ
jgi:hypothetical protein